MTGPGIEAIVLVSTRHRGVIGVRRRNGDHDAEVVAVTIPSMRSPPFLEWSPLTIYQETTKDPELPELFATIQPDERHDNGNQ